MFIQMWILHRAYWKEATLQMPEKYNIKIKYNIQSNRYLKRRKYKLIKT